ncbi:MAG: diguanylate cyclase [Candidatus Melainabacteria bacterium]|nr:diguanylate cyclase [Candidatus Melainabacteria bacterium]
MKNQFSQILKSYSAELAQLKPPSLTEGEGAKQKHRLRMTFLATVALAVLMIAVGVFTGHNIELIALGIVVAALLVYLYILQSRFLTQHEDYETKLHTMASTIEERNRELKHLVMIDPLTEVMNRRGFERILKSETDRARRNNTMNFALLIDCDDFKGINEKYGHSIGDVVLQELSARLSKAVRPTDHVARVGGDEFLILLSELDTETALQVAQRVRLAVAETPINLSSGTTKITTSTGVTQLPPELLSIEEILAAANAGLKSSKKAGKNSVTFSKLSPETNEMATILEKLRSGEALRATYQPIAQLKTQHVIGYEIQCRGPVGVFEQPDAYYKLAREHNLRTAIDLRCLKVSLENMEKLPDGGACHIKVFASTLLDIPVDNLEDMFKSKGREICVAIGDNEFLAEPLRIKPHVDRLKELGVQISLDRIGYGFSSLESLLLLAPQFIKLEKGLVKKCVEDDMQREFVRKLVGVASGLDCKVIADGIESRDDLQVMIDCGVECGQGLFWGMPVFA